MVKKENQINKLQMCKLWSINELMLVFPLRSSNKEHESNKKSQVWHFSMHLTKTFRVHLPKIAKTDRMRYKVNLHEE